ncbi:MAG TPA: diguanylate cyclase [Polyangiaceae bacterium]|nr:diguanylate cyclase [Polyangiaceae bacterium]
MSSTPRLLFVDDDAMVSRLFERLAGKMGYVVDIAAGSTDAMRMSTFREYDVIATDLMMSGMNGIELVERLAATSPSTVFLLVTGAADLTPFYSKVADRRIAGVLAKPFEPERVEQALEGAFAMSARRREAVARSERKSRTLLVEDSPTDALILSDALEALDGAGVEHVSRLSDAVRMLHDQRFDTIVTDLSLPDARGLDAVSRLRTCSADATLIVCSAVTDDALELQVIELGAHDFLAKAELSHASVARAVRFARVRRSTERRLARLAFYDALTGLANRTLFHERLGDCIRQRARVPTCGVMFLDLNGFKRINDDFGHDAGDFVLCEFASRVRGSVRDSDLVARLGGDEFAILAPAVDKEQLEVLARRIVVAACRPVTFGEIEIPVATSIGLAMFPECGDSPQQLLSAADMAMYEAKRGGGEKPIRVATSAPAPVPSGSPGSRHYR